MKIIHTADWHLGQMFHNFDRSVEHQLFLSWLCDIVAHEKPDAIVIAGDIFDVSNPSAQAQKMYYDFLVSVGKISSQIRIFIIAGNHDSAYRLEAPSQLLQIMNIYVAGAIHKKGNGEIDYGSLVVPMNDNADVVCLLVPFIRNGDVSFDNSSDDSTSVVRKVFSEVSEYAVAHYPQARTLIGVGHFYATGSEIAADGASERLVRGGLDNVDVSDFPAKISYLAMGHIHKAQKIAGKDNMRYAGSPLPMSFAEKGYNHGVCVVEVDDNGVCNVRRCSYEPPVKLLSIPSSFKPLSDVLSQLEELPQKEVGDDENLYPYIEINVLLDAQDIELGAKIDEQIKDKKVRKCNINTSFGEGNGTDVQGGMFTESFDNMDLMDIATAYYKEKKEMDMPQKIYDKLESVYNEVLNEMNN